MPSFFIVTLKRLYVPPYMAVEQTKWSPLSQMLNAFSASAVEKIEALGGKAEVI